MIVPCGESSPPVRCRRIAVVIDTSQGFGRGVLQGISAWIHRHEPWTLLVAEDDLAMQLPNWLARGPIDGVISRLERSRLPRELLREGLPLVRLASVEQGRGTPGVYSNEESIGRLAADHLIDQGFRDLGFCGVGTSWSAARQRGFASRCQERRCRIHAHDDRWRSMPCGSIEEHDAMRRWLRALPRPIGILAATDVRAVGVLEACRDLGLNVPGEVAVMGVDNDETLCGLAVPALTSVAQNLSRIGSLAADMLFRLMHSSSDQEVRSVFVPPLNVKVRGSTDTLALDDRELIDALSIIRRRACDGLGIDELIGATPLSRRTLERRIKAALGRSVREEILRVRIATARRLLEETDFKLQVIASKSGFPDVAALCHAFKRLTGMRPSEIRKAASADTDSAAWAD